MSFPAGLTLVTVTCRFDLPPTGGAPGWVTFTSPGPLTGPTDNSIVPPFQVTAALDANGMAVVILPATNAPAWVPTGWSYRVTGQFGSAQIKGSASFAYDTPVAQLADTFVASGVAESGITYATMAQVEDLLSGYQPVGDYVTLDFLNSQNLVSYETLQEELVQPRADILDLQAEQIGPLEHGGILTGWSFDPVSGVQAGTVMATAGRMEVVRFRALSNVITNLHFHITTPGSGLTANGCFAALYNDAGAILGGGAITADQAAAWAVGGFKTMPLLVAQGVTKNAWYKMAWWYTGTTGPTISRGLNSSSAIVNAGISVPPFRYATADTGRTTAASVPANLGTQTGAACAWWMGVS